MNKLSIRDLEMSGKRVFIRVDFNVPLSDSAPYQVTDDTRIRETLPTLKLARERGAKIVLASHLGRPKGKPNPKYSLQPAAAKLAELLGAKVEFAVGLRWRGSGIKEQSACEWRSSAAGKCALPRGRGSE